MNIHRIDFMPNGNVHFSQSYKFNFNFSNLIKSNINDIMNCFCNITIAEKSVIKNKKINDIMGLLKFIDYNKRSFYENYLKSFVN